MAIETNATMPLSPMMLGGNGGMFSGGGNDGWLTFLIIAMMFGGWGGNGFGNRNNGFLAGEGLADQFALQDVKNGIRANGNGICDATYAMAQQSGLTRDAVTNSGYAINNSIKDLGSQLASCLVA